MAPALARATVVMAVFCSAAIVGGCTSSDRPPEAEPGLVTSAPGGARPSAGGHGATSTTLDRCQIPEPGPSIDWITDDLPVPAGTYPVRELPTGDPSFRSAVLVAPVSFTEFSDFALATWSERGWLTVRTEVEGEEADTAFIRGDEWGFFRARRAYCRDNWTEVELSLGHT